MKRLIIQLLGGYTLEEARQFCLKQRLLCAEAALENTPTNKHLDNKIYFAIRNAPKPVKLNNVSTIST